MQPFQQVSSLHNWDALLVSVSEIPVVLLEVSSFSSSYSWEIVVEEMVVYNGELADMEMVVVELVEVVMGMVGVGVVVAELDKMVGVVEGSVVVLVVEELVVAWVVAMKLESVVLEVMVAEMAVSVVEPELVMNVWIMNVEKVEQTDEEMGVVEMIPGQNPNLDVEETMIVEPQRDILIEIFGVEEGVLPAPRRDVSRVIAEVVVGAVYPDLKRNDVNVRSEGEVVILALKMDVVYKKVGRE